MDAIIDRLFLSKNLEGLRALAAAPSAVSLPVPIRLKLLTAISALGPLSEALEPLTEALTIDPTNYAVLNNLGLVYHRQYGDVQRSEDAYRRCMEGAPRGFIGAYLGLLGLYESYGMHDKRGPIVEEAFALFPDDPAIRNIYGLYLVHTVRGYDSVVGTFQSIIEGGHDEGITAKACHNLGYYYEAIGDTEKATALYLDAIRHDPPCTKGYSNLIFATNYFTDPPDGSERLAKRLYPIYSQYFPSPSLFPRYRRDRNGGRRKIRVGYIGGDFVDHAVSHFIAVLFELRTVEHYVYSTKPIEGIKGVFIGTRSTEEVMALLETDGVDLVVDLAGHTSHNRLDVIHCAVGAGYPTISFIGYPAGNGICPRLSDWYSEGLEGPVEGLFRGPFLYYTPPEGLYRGTAQPEAPSILRFGCFAKLEKIGLAVVKAFCSILRGREDCIIVLKNKQFQDPKIRELWWAKFEEGVGRMVRERVSLLPAVPLKNHYEMYQGLDLCLDTWPYSGTTITMEALHSGVPVVTYCPPGSRRHVSRVTASILHHYGLDDLIMPTVEDYVRFAVEYVPRRVTARGDKEGYLSEYGRLVEYYVDNE